MALTILGLSGALSHDPSAALYIDGKLIAAAEEERFVRDKHADILEAIRTDREIKKPTEDKLIAFLDGFAKSFAA